jgi:hypothetical protein
VSAKSTKRLLALLLISVAGTFLPAFPEKIRELMETMSKARIVSNIPAGTETAEDVLEKYARRRRKKRKRRR